jgi:hypothetical protein
MALRATKGDEDAVAAEASSPFLRRLFNRAELFGGTNTLP